MELKTLKDMPPQASQEIYNQNLRQEAIKHIKDCEHPDIPQNIGQTEMVYGCNSKHRCSACLRFINFFNITEEDLK